MALKLEFKSFWLHNKKHFSPLKAYTVNPNIFRFLTYHSLTRKTPYVLLILAFLLFGMFALLSLMLPVIKGWETNKQNAEKLEMNLVNFFLAITYSISSGFATIFSIIKTVDITKALNNEGYDLIIVTKPYYRQQIILTKLIFLIAANTIFSLILTIGVAFLTWMGGTYNLKRGAWSFIAWSFFGTWISSFLFSAITGALSLKLKQRTSIILALCIYYIGGWIGGAIKPISNMIVEVRTNNLGIELEENSREPIKEIFAVNPVNLKENVELNKQTVLLLRKGAAGFNQAELDFIKHVDQINWNASFATKFLEWLNVPFQLSVINPVNYDAVENNFEKDFFKDTVESYKIFDEAVFTRIGNSINTYVLDIHKADKSSNSILLLIKDKDQKPAFIAPNFLFQNSNFFSGYLQQKHISAPKNQDLLLTVYNLDSEEKDFFEKKFQSEIKKIQEVENPEIKKTLQEILDNKIRDFKAQNWKSYSDYFSLNWRDIKEIFNSDKFETFMKKFFENQYFSELEKQSNTPINKSVLVDKTWFINKLTSEIARELEIIEVSKANIKELFNWLVSAIYWSYLYYSNDRIAKVLTANDKALSDFSIQSLVVEIQDKKYAIGGVLSQDVKNSNSLIKSMPTQQEEQIAFLFSHISNYGVLNKFNNAVSKNSFITIWILLGLIFYTLLFVIFTKKDFK